MKKALGFMAVGAVLAGIGMAIRDLVVEGVFENLPDGDCDCCDCCDCGCDCCCEDECYEFGDAVDDDAETTDEKLTRAADRAVGEYEK